MPAAPEPPPAPGPAAGDPERVAELEDAWAARVRASREQAERVRAATPCRSRCGSAR